MKPSYLHTADGYDGPALTIDVIWPPSRGNLETVSFHRENKARIVMVGSSMATENRRAA